MLNNDFIFCIVVKPGTSGHSSLQQFCICSLTDKIFIPGPGHFTTLKAWCYLKRGKRKNKGVLKAMYLSAKI